ncbi:hypothetical protein SAMN05192558_10311 [Actinokineospora alba]|uniref:Extracellular repeat, HAF family n=1 Tax=Actinokineospora alba TaxID=504798 RepID=A0A1H0JAW3_9PSEU|nr:hypothetical protein [Actinokineospora alba]TDP68366.1 hypothetical protein C8E96_3931 [Actinokineospora alba]SDH77576.1 hypothetical protein SAMN05421871_10242 [Actinokineospora alba]SDO40742.1 hypothetical protein SAMN05192558_10311 [Actinokineospora alba]
MRITRRRSAIIGVLVAIGAAVTPSAQAELLGIAVPVDMGSTQLGRNAWVTDYGDSGVVIGQSGTGPGETDVRGATWKNGKVTDLGPGANPLAVNGTDVVVGYQGDWSDKTARLWRPDGTSVDLAPAGEDSVAVAVNDRGEALVSSGAAIGVWRPSGGFTPLAVPGTPKPLGHLPQYRRGDINNLGQVALTAKDGGQAYAVRCDPAGCVRLPNPAGLSINEAEVRGMNDAGQIAGVIEIRPTSGNPNFTEWRAVLWQGDEVVLLDTLGGVDSGVAGGEHAINERGEIIGRARTSGGPSKAVVWRGLRPVVIGDTGTSPSAINDNGDIVGTTSAFGGSGFLLRAGKMTTLPALLLVTPYQGPTSVAVTGITDSGLIVGTCSRPIAPYPYYAGHLHRATRWTLL